MDNKRSTNGRVILGLLLCWSLCATQGHGVRIYKSRKEAMSTLSGVTAESQQHFGSCKQSSNEASCVLAMDDELSSEWTQCATTNPDVETLAFWRGYIEVPIYVTKVKIYNAVWQNAGETDGLTEFTISGNGQECYSHADKVSFSEMSFPCDLLADDIVIRTTLPGAMLTLCEVQVFGAPLNFINVRGAKAPPVTPTGCWQSSTEKSRPCWLAIDGNLHTDAKIGACAMTTNRDSEWWTFKFEVPALVQLVRITNRGDCCQDELTNFEINVGDRRCARYNSDQAFDEKTFYCNLFGDDVTILQIQPGVGLTLCEVSAAGFPVDMNLNKKQPLGCYVNNPDDPDMFERKAPVSMTSMEVSKCERMCRRLKKKYFGLQAGTQCWCADEFGKHGPAKDIKECGTECEGNRKDYCGGVNRMVVYQLDYV